MIDIFLGIDNWIKQKKPFAIATVIHTWGSAPRLVGAAMAVSEDMDMLGSVSGGCVEGAVVQEALEVLKTGVPKRLAYGIKDEDAWTVGLSCGGELHVFVERFMGFDELEEEQAVGKAFAKRSAPIRDVYWSAICRGKKARTCWPFRMEKNKERTQYQPCTNWP